MGLRHKDLISIHDLEVGEVATILDVAKKLKRKQKRGEPHRYLEGKTLAMIFSKASTRTRVSFETGFYQLGGHPIYLNDSASQIGRGEPVRDTARVLSRFVDGIMIRTFSHESVIELAKYATVPVINGLTDLLHPCQALTDMFTIMEHKEVLKGRKLVYVGDGNNMAHSLMYACAKVGMNMVCASPKGYQPHPEIVKNAQADVNKQTDAKKKKELAEKYEKQLASKREANAKEYASKLKAADTAITAQISKKATELGYTMVLPKSGVICGGDDITATVLQVIK